ncbi:MAG: AEC family transporter [Chitinispirillales bacterium]|jgi:predicted permease|nr:AEC family transporter [Chitinispirillales bacterium]
MDTTRLIEILQITLPVFAIMGVGNIISRTGKMTGEHRTFLNWLVYYICLPVLIFTALVAQPFGSLFGIDLIIGTFLSMLAVFLFYAALAAVLRIKGKTAIVMIFSTYWANVAYMGFPLSVSAFGDKGLVQAAIVNAVSMPAFIAVTFIMISFYTDKRSNNIFASLRGALINPVVLASVIGLTAAWAADALGFNGENAAIPIAAKETFAICESILKMIGSMGLPLALLSVGGNLRLSSLGKKRLPLVLAVAGKLILVPLITLIIMRTFFASAQKEVTGAAVLLMATPMAVAASVVAAKFKLDEQFVSSILAVSTVLSVVTIPFWLYIIL